MRNLLAFVSPAVLTFLVSGLALAEESKPQAQPPAQQQPAQPAPGTATPTPESHGTPSTKGKKAAPQKAKRVEHTKTVR